MNFGVQYIALVVFFRKPHLFALLVALFVFQVRLVSVSIFLVVRMLNFGLVGTLRPNFKCR